MHNARVYIQTKTLETRQVHESLQVVTGTQ